MSVRGDPKLHDHVVIVNDVTFSKICSFALCVEILGTPCIIGN